MGYSSQNPAKDDWIDRARRADVWAVLGRVSKVGKLKLRGGKAVGPCPACGGTDRFSVDRHKNVFFCRRSGKGGDAIALVQYLEGADFLGAVEIITGEAPPDGASNVKHDPELLAARCLERDREDEKRSRDASDFRQKEIDRAAKIWREGAEVSGSAVERYLTLRGLVAPAGARLRCHPSLRYWEWSVRKKAFQVLHESPAMLARIDDAEHRFQGVHCTYIDLNQKKGKAEIVNPESGEILPAKKMRGAKKGGHIHLGGSATSALKLFVGEGIETVLSVQSALLAAGRTLDDALFWTSCDLGNLGGPSEMSVVHPVMKRIDSRGHSRSLKVPGPVPLWRDDEAILMPPRQITDVTLLGDGDSDRFSTEQHLKRANARWASPGRHIRAAWAANGADFGDMWQRKNA